MKNPGHYKHVQPISRGVRVYWYFRKPGCERVKLPGAYGSPEFAEAYRIAMGGSPIIIGARSLTNDAGTFSALIDAYFASDAWLNAGNLPGGLSEGTRGRRRPIIEKLRREHGHRTVSGCTADDIKVLLQGLTAHQQLDLFKNIRALLQFAVDTKAISADPSRSVKIVRAKGEGFRCWSDEEIEQFRAYWANGTQARLAFELTLETASRRCEVFKLSRAHVKPAKGDKPARIFIARAKGSNDSTIALSPELKAAIDAMPVSIDPNTPFLVNDHGEPISIDLLGRRMAAWADEAKLPKHCRLHGLKKANIRQMTEAGVAPAQGMAVSGHKTLAVYQHYFKKYDSVAAADTAVQARINARARG